MDMGNGSNSSISSSSSNIINCRSTDHSVSIKCSAVAVVLKEEVKVLVNLATQILNRKP